MLVTELLVCFSCACFLVFYVVFGGWKLWISMKSCKFTSYLHMYSTGNRGISISLFI